MPHEADYVLEIPKDKSWPHHESCRIFDDLMFLQRVSQITKNQFGDISDGLGNWIIHGVHHHQRIGGVCLFMQYSSSETSDQSEVGVTVDLVPVIVKKTFGRIKCFNRNAEDYLPYSLQEYIEQGDIYMLINSDAECDTGIVENRIMKELPENQKRPFRIMKFFLQNTITSPGLPMCLDVIGVQET